MQTVSEVMTRNVQYVAPHETVRRAAQLMDDLNVGALPVCEGERLVGMVTDRDITVRATSAGMAPDQATVDDVMSADVRWCFEDQPLDDVVRQMADTQIRRLPVVSHDDAHRLIGIVSLGDLATKADDARKPDVEEVMEKVSFPSKPDRSPATGAIDTSAGSGAATGVPIGMAGSDVSADRMAPDIEISATADPSDIVEVTPADLVNRNAPGSASLSPEGTGGGIRPGPDEVVVVRRTAAGGDTTTGESGAPGGTDATGISGASGGITGTAGSGGTGVGAKAGG